MMEPVIPWVIVGLLGFIGTVTWYTSMQVATLTERVDNLKNERDIQMLALEKRVERLEDGRGGSTQ